MLIMCFLITQFDVEYPDDQAAATKAFAAFMGRFGQATNTLRYWHPP